MHMQTVPILRASILGLSIVFMTALIGCGTPQYVHRHHIPSFLPEMADSATPTTCRVVLIQDDPFIGSQVTHAAGVPFVGIGLIDIALTAVFNAADNKIHEIANRNRQENAVRMSAPLMGHGLGASFRGDLQSSLSTALSSSPWLHTTPLEMTREYKQGISSEANEHPVIEIIWSYNLSSDASALIMQAILLYYRQGQPNAPYVRHYTYFSEPIGPERDDAAVARWVSSNQELLRRRMKEGMSEVIEMLERDFIHPALMDPANPSVKISCYDVLTLSHVQWEGHILRKGNPRVIFQEKLGGYFSIIPDSPEP
jgi:hypothetical protein